MARGSLASPAAGWRPLKPGALPWAPARARAGRPAKIAFAAEVAAAWTSAAGAASAPWGGPAAWGGPGWGGGGVGGFLGRGPWLDLPEPPAQPGKQEAADENEEIAPGRLVDGQRR